MTTDPNNTRYHLDYDPKEDGWGPRMDAIMDTLDRDVHQEGTLANRPAADASQSPAWFYATDTDELYHNEGSSWLLHSTSGASGGGSAKTTVYLSDYTSGGVADSAFDTAVNDANAGDTLLIDVGIELTQQHTISKPLIVDAVPGVTVSCTNTSNNNPHIFFQGGGLGSSTTTTEKVNVGERSIDVNDSTIFSAGDRVLLIEDTYASNVNSRIHFDEVELVSSGTVQLMGTINKPMVSGTNVYAVDLLEGPVLRNIKTDGGGNRHLQFRWCEEPIYDNVHVSEYLEVSLYGLDCWKPRWINCKAIDPTGLLSGEGEPIAAYRCMDGYIESPRVYDCRRGVDFGWGSRNFTVVDPVLHGCVIGGITVHQDDESGAISIQGGHITCSTSVTDSAHNGHGISMSSTAEAKVEGTDIVARANGILASGPMQASNVTIRPADDTPEGNAAILIQASNSSFSNIEIEDPDGHFDEGIWLDASNGEIHNVDIHCHNCEHGNTSILNVDGRNNAISDVTVSGNYYQTTTSANQAFIIQADATNRVENIHITANVHNVPEQAIRIESNTDGVLDNIVVADGYFSTGQAAVFSNGSGTFETLRVQDSSMDTGSTSISFNETANKIWITNNDISGSIDVGSNSNVVQSGNQ